MDPRKARVARALSSSRPTIGPSPGRGADRREEPDVTDLSEVGARGGEVSLAESRRKRRARIARRAAMVAAADAAAEALTEGQPEEPEEARQVEAGGVLASAAAARAGSSAVGAGAKRAVASVRGFSRGFDEGLGRPPRKTRLEGARRRVTKVVTMKSSGAASAAPVRAEVSSPIARFAAGEPVLPRHVRARRKGPGGWLAGAALALVTPVAAFALLLGLAALGGAAGGAVLGGGSRSASVEGLPGWFTSEMVLAALEMQEQYGHPAGCTIAQALVESGSGGTPSQLAREDHNLFGMKWWSGYAGAPEVEGPSSYPTMEEKDGVMYWVDAQFIRFKSAADCIRFRSNNFLQGSRYADNPTIKSAIEQGSSDLMAEGLKEAGWATSSSYVESIKTMMDAYQLRRFDTMTPETWMQIQASGSNAEYLASDALARHIKDCTERVGSPGPGLCAKWVSEVYKRAGCGYPPGNACDMYYAFCTSSDRSELKVGMTVGVPSYAGDPTGMGQIYGHVAIYIGGGMVRENIGAIHTQPLDNWIAHYGNTHEVRWGYPPGVQGK